jgi:hypothetical protein
VLKTLGIDSFRVETIHCRAKNGGVAEWAVSLVAIADSAEAYSFQWSTKLA